MRGLISSILCFAAFAAVTAGSAQTTGTALCDGIAAKIRGNPAIASGDLDPMSLLSQGDPAYIELATKSDFPGVGDATQFTSLFRENFDPSDALARAIDGFSDPQGNATLFSLSGSDLHVVETVSGSADCESFLFFRASPGSRAELLPGPPPKGPRDGDNLICSGFHDDGQLARIAGSDVFLNTSPGMTGNSYLLRVVPFKDGRWGSACTVEADFATTYDTHEVFVLDGGPVSQAALRKIAADFVEQHAAAADPKSFTFGPPVPAGDQQDVSTMIALASNTHEDTVPAFGGEGLLSAYWWGGSLAALQQPDPYPLVLDGRVYLMRIEVGGIGWRDSSDSVLILYDLKDGKLEPVATAIVHQDRGALKSLRVTASH